MIKFLVECLLIDSLINSEKVVEPSAPSGSVYGGGPSDYVVPPSRYQVFFSLLSVNFFFPILLPCYTNLFHNC